ncbi:MAG: hypothetical protein FWC91_10715 [Defluviitaleaceae bacterium]|nr:hypothetical protein [Defluviitaleaceae bacterium]
MTKKIWKSYTHILPLDTSGITPRCTKKLWNLRPFLIEPKDVSLIEHLYAYDVPHVFTITNEVKDNKTNTFLCIATFPGKLSASGDLQTYNNWVSELTPYSKLLSEAPPHLSAMIFSGWVASKSAPLDPFETEAFDEFPAPTAEAALLCKDIFVIYGKRGLSKVFTAIVHELLMNEEFLSSSKGILTADQYKKRILVKNRPDFSLVDRVEMIRVNFENFAFTYHGAISALQEVYLDIVPLLNRDIQYAYNNIMNELTTGTFRGSESISDATNYAALKRLRRSVYALPTNTIVYEDNGDTIIKETILRIELLPIEAAVDKMKDGLSALKELSESINSDTSSPPSEEWFGRLKKIRKNLLNALNPGDFYPGRIIYLSNYHKNRIISLLGLTATTLQDNIEQAFNKKNEILLDYLKNIDPKAMHKYLNPLDGTRPFVHKGTAVIDMDACYSESAAMEAAINADRLIMLGGFDKGLFYMMVQAALYRQQKDGINRLIKYVPYDPEEFDEYEDVADDLTFGWVFRKSKKGPLAPHVLEMFDKRYSIGILTPDQSTGYDIDRELKIFGVDTTKLRIGTLSNLYHETFDVLYWLPSKNADERSLYVSIAKVKKCLVVVWGEKTVDADSPLRDIYDICAGDDKHGRVYH